MSTENNSVTPNNDPPGENGLSVLTGFQVFLESGLRQIGGVLRRFETTRCEVLALETVPGNPAALLKIVVTYPNDGRIILERAGLPFTDYRLVGVVLPDGVQPLLRILLPLAQGNVLVRATHTVLLPNKKRALVLLEAEPVPRAVEILLTHGFNLVPPELFNEETQA
ncbi:hypothetical protein THTE_1736 [Thermogutta terrifontis]|jgi:hypothetical protein|uniref:ACT domain-containing protein n=1 Tax=Thermogutta terrifontis TaxID=1331910 RepID=A0A286REF9_9BACT|nr:hypothetical protein [Thermogutta terrifontis]ASV74338.1 hypothetical protein THTE_1736 [Thermogutta terrifontis]